MNEKIKNLLKLVGILVGIFLLLNIFNYFTSFQNSSRKILITDDYSADKETLTNNKIESKSQSTPASMINEDFSNTKSLENPSISDKKIIKNGNLNLKIKTVEEAVNKIIEIVKTQNGEIFSTNFSEKVKGQKSGFIMVKVPVKKFETTLKEIKTVATQVVSESTTGQDVTEQYSDLQAQLRNKRTEEESFTKILEGSGKIADVLAVTKELSRVRGEIERLEGKIRFMDSRTEMSTITIDLNEDVEITPANNNWRPWQIVKESFNELINNSQDFINNLIRFFVVGIPSILTLLIGFGLVYWIGKKLWNKFIK